MSGFFGFGQSGGEKASTAGLNNIFNTALPIANKSEASGSSALGTASDYFTKLLTAGRSDTAARSAPAINSELAGADATKRREATSGTSRTGGTAELNRESGEKSRSNIDNIINENLVGGQKEGAAGLTQIGSADLSHALAALGLGAGTQDSLLNAATNKENAQTKGIGDIISAFI